MLRFFGIVILLIKFFLFVFLLNLFCKKKKKGKVEEYYKMYLLDLV